MSDSDSEDETKKVAEVQRSSSESSYDYEYDIPPVPEKSDEEGVAGTLQTMAALQPKPRMKRFIPKYDVEGVYTVALGEETQIQIEIMIGTHVNAQYPWKLVSRAKVMETIELGGELSEFFPMKEALEAYTEEEILMGYIVDESKDTDEFYVCCTIESRDHCKQQSDKFIKRQEKKLQKKIHKSAGIWKSLGSEKELLAIAPVNTRSLMEMEIKAKFPTVYQPEKFKVRDTNSCRDGFIELTPYRQRFNNVFKRRVDTACQAAAPRVNREAQTVLRYPQNMWTQSIADALGKVDDFEGGGDAGQDMEKKGEDDDESYQSDNDIGKESIDEVVLENYRAALKKMRRPSYIKTINSFMGQKRDEMDSILELNTVMDMYCNDYPNLVSEKIIDIYDSMTFEEYVCFTDVRAKDKYVSCAVFHPMWSGIIAISYADGSPSVMKTTSLNSPDPIQRAVYGLNPVLIWSHIDSLIPKLYLESPREVKTLSFCPFDENILVGGCVNGQVIVWDLTHKLENVEKVEVLSEIREKYRIAMNSNMGWMKNVQDNAVVQSTVLSNLMTSHYGPVTSIRWLSPNFTITPTGKPVLLTKYSKSLIFLSGSEDGNILIWNLSVDNLTIFDSKKIKKSRRVMRRPSGLMVDISPLKVLDRNLQPCYKIIVGHAGQPQTLAIQSFAMSPPILKYVNIQKNDGSGRKYFTCQFVPQIQDDINTVLYCGSQHGELRKITWEGHEFNTGEVVNSEYCDSAYSCHIHDGIIVRTKKNPFLSDITITVGGKIFAIWSDKLKDRPLTWKKRPYRLTDAEWSLYKPSLIFLSTSVGDVETWDLLVRSDEPISVQTLSGSMLTGMSIHTLPLVKNIIGVSDINGSFRMFLYPPIFMIENSAHIKRMEKLMYRQTKLMTLFDNWQKEWMKNNPQIILEMKRKEGMLLLEKEEERKKIREEEAQRLEEEAEARRLERMKVIGPEERWQKIIQKLIERTIAVKKRINRAELIEHEKPLRELEAQRLEKERRMLEIMKNQQTIFTDTVAILFPEAILKTEKLKKSLLSDDKTKLKKDYLEEYEFIKASASKMVRENPYRVEFSWQATIVEGRERREALFIHQDFVNMHRMRIEEDFREPEPQNLSELKMDKAPSVATEEDSSVLMS